MKHWKLTENRRLIRCFATQICNDACISFNTIFAEHANGMWPLSVFKWILKHVADIQINTKLNLVMRLRIYWSILGYIPAHRRGHTACLSFVENRFVYNLSFACNNFAKFDTSVWNRRNHLILECRSYLVAVMNYEFTIRSIFEWKHCELTKLMISLSLFSGTCIGGYDCQHSE